MQILFQLLLLLAVKTSKFFVCKGQQAAGFILEAFHQPLDMGSLFGGYVAAKGEDLFRISLGVEHQPSVFVHDRAHVFVL